MKIFTIITFFLLINLNSFCQTTNASAELRETGSLTLNPTAQPDNICPGESVQLFSHATGGSNNYTYLWTSSPEGFNSNLAEPFVSPDVTTVYNVLVSDGTTTTSGSVTVTVKPGPVINLLPDGTSAVRILSSTEISACPFLTVPLDAGNQGCTYLWSNGSTDRKIIASTSGITNDVQEFHVTVTNPANGCTSDADIIVYFQFDECVYGIGENTFKPYIQIYPNPSEDGLINCIIRGYRDDVNLRVISSKGEIIYEDIFMNCSGAVQKLINLGNEVPGVYLLQVLDQEMVLTQKILLK